DRPDSVVGQEAIAQAFGPGFGEPLTIVAGPNGDDVLAVARRTPGVLAADVGVRGDDRTQINVRLRDDPGSAAAQATVEQLRERLDAGPTNAVVGGLDAEELDKRT